MSLDEFSETLSSLLSAKPPGVSGSKIRKITELAVKNVQDESVIVQKLYTHCKKTPSSHKLGALYAVDAVVRAYQDQARNAGQAIDASAKEGTFAGATYRIGELITSIVDDVFATPPPLDQKEKIRKLVDIWERASTFSPEVIKSIRDKYLSGNDTSTPPMSPPTYIVDSVTKHSTAGKETAEPAKPAAVNVPDTASILQALANIAKHKPAEPAAAPAASVSVPPPPGVSSNLMDILKTVPAAAKPNPVPASRNYNNNMHHQRRDRSRSPSRDYQDHGRMRSRSPPRRGDDRDRSRGPQSGDIPMFHPPPENYTRQLSKDSNLPRDSIRIYSRTLFVGGVGTRTTEDEIVRLFEPYAAVQSLVFHKEKRHGFIKVYQREGAERAKRAFDGMNRNGQVSLRVRWGVGFGPRDCSDYQTGISVIPISRLTEADKRWIVDAEYGGTGGAPLEPGLCMEEPDIEIGAGVSSKAISRRMPTNSSLNGPKSTRDNQGSERPREKYAEHKSGQFPMPGSSFPPNFQTPPAELQAFLAQMQQAQAQNGQFPNFQEMSNQFGQAAQSGNNQYGMGAYPYPPIGYNSYNQQNGNQ